MGDAYVPVEGEEGYWLTSDGESIDSYDPDKNPNATWTSTYMPGDEPPVEEVVEPIDYSGYENDEGATLGTEALAGTTPTGETADYEALSNERLGLDENGDPLLDANGNPIGGADFANYEDTGFTPKETGEFDENGDPIMTTDPAAVKAGEDFVSPESTVAGQLEKIFAAGSPLQDLAETRAKERASALGMSSSSAAIGAGQRALYDSAMPIAQQDAQTFATAKLEEQKGYNTQSEINREAQVAGDLNIQTAKIAETQTAINDSFAIQLEGLKSEDAIMLTNLKGEWDKHIAAVNNDLARNIAQLEVDANVEQTIINQAGEAMNQVQISWQQLMGSDDFLNNMGGDDAAMETAFNKLMAPALAVIVSSGKMAGVYDEDFQNWVDDLAIEAEW